MKICKKIILFPFFIGTLLVAQDNNWKSDSLTTLQFSFVGDIMCHSTQFKFAAVGKDTFDFKPVYREIKPYLQNSDLVVGNLETVIEVESLKYAGYPIFNTPKDFLCGLKYAGFDILSTANNHAFDIRERGVESTIKHIKDFGLKNVGTYSSIAERDSAVVFEKNGIKFSILSYTFGVNIYKIPKEKSYLVNVIKKELIDSDIKKCRNAGAEIVILFLHFGKEYERDSNSYQREVVQNSIASGADIIIGAHPHTLQPIEYFKTNGGTLDSGFVAYSLGNFISNQRWRYSDGGAVLSFSITKNKFQNKCFLSGVRFLPIWVFKGETENGLEYVILPSDLAFEKEHPKYLSDEDIKLMAECNSDTKSILMKYEKNIEVDNFRKNENRWIKRDFQNNSAYINSIPILSYSFESHSSYSDTLNMLPNIYQIIIPNID